MKLLPLPLLAAALMVACERNEGVRGEVAPAEARRLPGSPRTAADGIGRDGVRAVRPPEPDRGRRLVETVLRVPDDELWTVLEEVKAESDPSSKRAMMATVYEETLLRPELVRFPVLLEMARQPDIDPGLRDTILAELGTALSTDHGASWADWALSLEEHLAASEGLIRVD